MPYNPTYNKSTWSSEELVTSTKLNQMVDNTDHNQKFKLQCGPDHDDYIIARGVATLSLSSENKKIVTVTFNTDAEDGSPTFVNEPRVALTLENHYRISDDIYPVGWGLKSKDANGMELFIDFDSGVSLTGDYYIEWIAVGRGSYA